MRWVWSPYINCSGCSSFSSVYPGNSYVDWVALDGYDWGTTLSGSSWQSMAQVFGPSYNAVTALAPTKPFMSSEVSSAEKGGSKAEWIRNAFNRDIPNRLPKTKAVVWFSADFTAAGETDWRVNSSDASLQAYKEVAALTSYQGQLPLVTGSLLLDRDLSSRTVQYTHAVLHRGLKQAVRWGLVPRNVCEDVTGCDSGGKRCIFWIEANFCLTIVGTCRTSYLSI